MTSFGSIVSVQKSIELQKELLQSTDNTIVKITGRLPGEDRQKIPEVKSAISRSISSNGAPSSVVSRIEPNTRSNDDVSIQSSVVRVGEKRTRSDAIKEYKNMDQERGRRMFGILQQTLSQSKAETNEIKRKRRLEIESRIEAKAAEEKAAAKQERADLFRQRKAQQLELSLLQHKVHLMNEFEIWKEEQMKMVDFIRTEQGPPIFYRPKACNKESESRKSATKAKILELVEDRRRFLEAEYEEIATSRRKRLGITPSDLEETRKSVGNSSGPKADGDSGSPQRVVHITTAGKSASNNNISTVDFEDLVDEPVLMDEDDPSDRRIVSTVTE
nr:pinin [Hymenolepis microstoma]